MVKVRIKEGDIKKWKKGGSGERIKKGFEEDFKTVSARYLVSL